RNATIRRRWFESSPFRTIRDSERSPEGGHFTSKGCEVAPLFCIYGIRPLHGSCHRCCSNGGVPLPKDGEAMKEGWRIADTATNAAYLFAGWVLFNEGLVTSDVSLQVLGAALAVLSVGSGAYHWTRLEKDLLADEGGMYLV